MKKKIVLGLIIVNIFTIGCSNKSIDKVDNIEKQEVYTEVVDVVDTEEEKVEEVYTSFNLLDNVYEKNEDITLFEIGKEVFNNIGDNPYERNKFMEVDYANDIIEKYLSGYESIYNYLITIDHKSESGFKEATDDERNRLKESLQFLREQMYLSNDEPVYFRLSKVSYNGQADGIENSIVLDVSGHISADNINFLSLAKFTVTIVECKDKLLVNII